VRRTARLPLRLERFLLHPLDKAFIVGSLFLALEGNWGREHGARPNKLFHDLQGGDRRDKLSSHLFAWGGKWKWKWGQSGIALIVRTVG
jgi:hypothetical protein